MMFKNRKVTVRVEKATPKDPDEVRMDIALWEDRIALADLVARKVIRTVFVGVCGYVVLDTCRQVLIANSKIIVTR